MNRFVSLTDPHRPDLWRYCLRLTGSPWDAEDLIQETLVRALARWSEHGEPADARPYLFRIASNAWVDQQRRSGRLPLVQEELLSAETEGHFEEAVAAMEQLVQLLSPRQRVVLLLCDVFQFTAPEVAEMIGSTTGAVKAALHRARAELRSGRLAGAVGVPGVAGLAPGPVVTRFLDAFNRRDPDGIAALLAEDATFDNVGERRLQGRRAIRENALAFWAAGPSQVRARFGELAGRPVVFTFDRDGRLDGLYTLDVAGEQVVFMRGYFFTPDLIRYAAQELGVEASTHGYRYQI